MQAEQLRHPGGRNLTGLSSGRLDRAGKLAADAPSTAALVLVGLLAQAPAAGNPLAAMTPKASAGDFAGAAADAERLLPTAADRARVLSLLARLEQRTGQINRAVVHAREAAAAFAATSRPREASDAWNLAAMAEFTRGDCGTAATHLAQAIRLATDAGDAARQAEQTGNLGSVYFSLGRYDDAAAAFADGRAPWPTRTPPTRGRHRAWPCSTPTTPRCCSASAATPRRSTAIAAWSTPTRRCRRPSARRCW